MKEVFVTLVLNAVLRKVFPLKCILSFNWFCMLFISVLLNGLEWEFLKNTSMASVVAYHNCSHAKIWRGLRCSIAYRLVSVLPSGLSGHPAAMSKVTWKLLALCIPPTLSSLNDAIGYTPNGALYLWWLLLIFYTLELYGVQCYKLSLPLHCLQFSEVLASPPPSAELVDEICPTFRKVKPFSSCAAQTSVLLHLCRVKPVYHFLFFCLVATSGLLPIFSIRFSQSDWF